MESYVELVQRRFEDRFRNIMSHLDEFTDPHLRYTVRIFGDCLDEETRRELLAGYTEYQADSELREFVRKFLPAYAEYAIAELIEKKRDGERFEPPYLTQEEYQEMSVREKWPKIGEHLAHVPPFQLRREIAKAGLLFRPYMLSDPAFNEGVLEFALYFDLLDRLSALPAESLRGTAAAISGMVQRALAAATADECEQVLREIRERVAAAAGIEADPETLLGPKMEHYPREAPPWWKMRELRKTLSTMNLKDLRLSSLVHLDLLTTDETRAVVAPFISRYPSFYEIPSKGLQELILAIAEAIDDRAITYFFDRYGVGRMAMTPPVSFLVWKLMPEGEKLARLREDNEKMDQAMMARHLARYLRAASPADLSDAGKQIALLTDPQFTVDHGSILKNVGNIAGEQGVKRLYDEVTALSLRMVSRPDGERQECLQGIRTRIADAAGLPVPGESREGGS